MRVTLVAGHGATRFACHRVLESLINPLACIVTKNWTGGAASYKQEHQYKQKNTAAHVRRNIVFDLPTHVMKQNSGDSSMIYRFWYKRRVAEPSGHGRGHSCYTRACWHNVKASAFNLSSPSPSPLPSFFCNRWGKHQGMSKHICKIVNNLLIKEPKCCQ